MFIDDEFRYFGKGVENRNGSVITNRIIDSFFENRANDSMFSITIMMMTIMMVMMMIMMMMMMMIIIIIIIIKSDKFTFPNPCITVQLLEFKPRKAKTYYI